MIWNKKNVSLILSNSQLLFEWTFLRIKSLGTLMKYLVEKIIQFRDQRNWKQFHNLDLLQQKDLKYITNVKENWSLEHKYGFGGRRRGA
ncbi:hypothetical protein [Aneurinibacillus soli]|nr:hypothetical protein [Aneurinibacillus soli]